MPVGLVLTIIARDRPGLVQRLAEAVADHGGNWIDSSMSRLAGEFAGIVLVEIPEASLAGLETALDGLGEEGISVASRRTGDTDPPAGRQAVLELTGGDHSGIVRDISSVLAKNDVSIDDLETEIFTGSMSGEKLFHARARIVIPDALTTEALSEALEDLAQDVMVDIEITEAL